MNEIQQIHTNTCNKSIQIRALQAKIQQIWALQAKIQTYLGEQNSSGWPGKTVVVGDGGGRGGGCRGQRWPGLPWSGTTACEEALRAPAVIPA
jgi:hypothetical protein